MSQEKLAKEVKKQVFGPFTVRIMKTEHEDYFVTYCSGDKLIEHYDSANWNAANDDYMMICTTIRNVLQCIRQSLGG